MQRDIIKTVTSFSQLKRYCKWHNFKKPLKTSANGVYAIKYGGKVHLVYKQ